MSMNNGIHSFYSLIILEMNTQGTVNTVNDVERRVLNSSQWVTVNAGTSEFKTVIPEVGYRSKVSQHTSVARINTVLMVCCAPGALVKQMILVHISDEQQRSLRMFQSLVTSTYMPFAYSLSIEIYHLLVMTTHLHMVTPKNMIH
jgi:hypothetical protein